MNRSKPIKPEPLELFHTTAKGYVVSTFTTFSMFPFSDHCLWMHPQENETKHAVKSDARASANSGETSASSKDGFRFPGLIVGNSETENRATYKDSVHTQLYPLLIFQIPNAVPLHTLFYTLPL